VDIEYDFDDADGLSMSRDDGDDINYWMNVAAQDYRLLDYVYESV
jgi:hypothetical protein